MNAASVTQIVSAFPDLPVQIGGGIRNMDIANAYIEAGVSYLIINIGHDVVEKPPFFMHEGGTQVIHINFNSAQVDEVYFPQLEIVGDIIASLSSPRRTSATIRCGNKG
jgi:thiamine pyrophosphate-dependent acetolactate synthase large subunit-like protein